MRLLDQVRHGIRKKHYSIDFKTVFLVWKSSLLALSLYCPKCGVLALRKVLFHEPLFKDIGKRLGINRL